MRGGREVLLCCAIVASCSGSQRSVSASAADAGVAPDSGDSGDAPDAGEDHTVRAASDAPSEDAPDDGDAADATPEADALPTPPGLPACSNQAPQTLVSGDLWAMAVGAGVLLRMQPDATGANELVERDLPGGADVVLVNGLSSQWPSRIAVDATSAYFFDSGNRVDSISLAGGTPTTLATDFGADALAVSGGYVYWTSAAGLSDGIFRVSTGGGPTETLIQLSDANGSPLGPGSPTSLFVDGPDLYWGSVAYQYFETTVCTDYGVFRMATTGGAYTALLGPSSMPNVWCQDLPPGFLAVTSGSGRVCYGSQYGVPDGTGIRCSSTDAGPAQQMLAGELANSYWVDALVIDGTSLYGAIFDSFKSWLVRIALDGSGVCVLATAPDISTIAVDATNVYWLVRGVSGTIATLVK